MKRRHLIFTSVIFYEAFLKLNQRRPRHEISSGFNKRLIDEFLNSKLHTIDRKITQIFNLNLHISPHLNTQWIASKSALFANVARHKISIFSGIGRNFYFTNFTFIHKKLFSVFICYLINLTSKIFTFFYYWILHSTKKFIFILIFLLNL